MASSYSGITDQGLSTQPYQQDFSFLQSNLMRSNQQYEQGLSQVKNDYSAITSSALTNIENIDKRKEYIDQIQQGLKKVSTTDLSLPQNVSQAENLYKPFWQDQDILYDQSATRQLQSEMQVGETDRQSKDQSIRDSYNPHGIARLQWAQNDLRNAKRGDGSIAKTYQNLPKYNPQIDPNTYMDSVDKAEGFKGADFETSDGNAGIIKEHDGIKAIPNFTTRLEAAIGSNFNPQFSDQGYNWYRQDKARLIRDNPNLPEDQINQKLGEQRYNDLKSIYARKVEDLSVDIKNKFDDPISLIQQQINSVNQKGKATPQQTQDINKLIHQKQDYQTALDKAQSDNEQFQKYPDKVIADVAKSPEDYYSRQVRETTIDNMARGRAMGDYSYELDVNKAWKAMSEDANWRTNAGLRNNEIRKDYYVANLHHQDAHEKNLIDAGWIYSEDGKKLIPPSATPANNQVQYLGQVTDDPQHTNFSDLLQQEKNYNLNFATKNTWSMNGVSGVLATGEQDGGLGLPMGTVTDLNTLYTRLYSPENLNSTTFKGTPTENAAFQAAYDKLSAALGKGRVPRTYDGVRDALYTYVSEQNAKRIATGTFTDTNNTFANAFIAAETSKDALQNYTSMSQQEHEWISHLAQHDPKYKPLLNDQGTALATTSDIAKYAPTLDVVDTHTGEHRTINPQEYASSYNRKSLNYTGPSNVDIDGKHYQIDAVNGQPNVDQYIEHGMHTGLPSVGAANRIVSRFGLYKDRDNLNSQLAEHAATNLKFIKDKTGKIGGEFLYNFGDNKHVGPGEKLISETLLPSNTIQWFDSNGKDISTDADFKSRLAEQASSYESIRKNIGQPKRSTVTEYGAPSTTFTLNQYSDAKGKTQPAQTVTAVQSPNAQGEFISSAPQSNGNYIYQKLLRGEDIKSDNMSNSMGFKYEITPDNRDHPTTVSVSITTKYNPNTGKLEDYRYPIQTYSLGLGVDKIMGAIREAQKNSIVNLAAVQKQYNNQNAK